MTAKKQKKPAKRTAEVRKHERHEPKVKRADENVARRENRDEPYVIQPFHDETE